MPDQNELRGDDGISIHNSGFFMEETMVTGNNWEILTQVENPISSSRLRPTVRRVVSEYNLGPTIRRVISETNLGPARDVPARSLGDSDSHISSSGPIIPTNTVENPAALSSELDTGSGSLESFEETSRSSCTSQEAQQYTFSDQATPESSETVGLRSEDHKAGCADCADCARTISDNDKSWKLVLKARKKTYKADLDDRQHEHDIEVRTLKTDHRNETRALKAKNVALQKKVQELQSGKVILEADLQAKAITMQHVIGASQTLQHKFDNLKVRCDRGSIECDSRVHNHQLPIIPAARNTMQAELETSRNIIQALSKGLADTQVIAATFEQRVREMSYVDTSKKSSSMVAEVSSVTEAEEHRYKTLAFRAGECLTALTELEKEKAHEAEIASGEIAFLKAELAAKEATVSRVKRSRDKFQRQCADVMAMLRGKIYKDNLIKAMEECFQTAMQDNSFLKNLIDRQDDVISSRDSEIEFLKTAVDGAGRSLDAKTKAADEVVLALSTKEVERGIVQMELDSLKSDHRDAIREKNEQLADQEDRMRIARESVLALMGMELDERNTYLLNSKDEDIAALEERYGELLRAHELCELEFRMQSDLSAANASQALLGNEELKDTQTKLQVAEAQIKAQQNQFRGRMGLPPSISMVTVLEMKRALCDAQLRIQELEGDD